MCVASGIGCALGGPAVGDNGRMPRANRRRADPPRPLGGLSGAVTTSESFAGRTWSVRRISGASSQRVYRCPGCQADIAVGLPHVVVWPADGLGSLEQRRHWHTACWSARDRRGPLGSY